ncbi:MAG: hypothetical protein RBR77_09950 [Thauera sp.]|jgi:hypothetical protein|nr:hypothetical protein [Thauera sp.]
MEDQDKYQALRDALPELLAEAARKGGENPRAKLIIELLAERDALAKGHFGTLRELPLATCALNAEEFARLEKRLKALLAFLGSPGDWGYRTQLGVLTIVLQNLLTDLRIDHPPGRR